MLTEFRCPQQDPRLVGSHEFYISLSLWNLNSRDEGAGLGCVERQEDPPSPRAPCRHVHPGLTGTYSTFSLLATSSFSTVQAHI